DQNAGIYATSPAASVVEDIAREWLLELFDLPRTSSVGFVTGGQMANFTALAAARHGVLRGAGWNVEEDGLAGAPPVHLVVSAAAHITIHFSMRMLGFGTRALIKVDADQQGRMRADALRATLRTLDGPIIVCVRDSASHRAAMHLSAEYLQQTTGVERDNFDWVPEFSRRARAFPIYAAIRALGRRGIAALIDGCCDRARQFAEILGRVKRVSILNEVVLNQVLVRFNDSDDVTRNVIARVQREGTCWLGGTTWQGNAAMRISVSNWSTTAEDVEKSCDAIVRCLDASE